VDLEQIKTLAALKYQHSQHALSTLLAREGELRAELERLSVLARETQTQPPEHAEIRAIGADIIWLKWLGQTQRQLNIALAQVLAQKEALMAEHRRTHGRKIVAEELALQAGDARRREKRQAQLQSTISHTLVK